MKNLALSFATVMMISAPAFATGGIWCQTDDATLKFEVSAVTSRSFAQGIVSADGLLEYKDTDGKPNVSVFRFVKEDIRQYWNNGEDLKLYFYQENDSSEDDYTWIQAVVETKANGDESEFKGTLKTKMASTVAGRTTEHEYEGNITCSVE